MQYLDPNLNNFSFIFLFKDRIRKNTRRSTRSISRLFAKKEGKREGKKEGMEAKAKETAKRMLEDGKPNETISKCTGLTEKEIKALMN